MTTSTLTNAGPVGTSRPGADGVEVPMPKKSKTYAERLGRGRRERDRTYDRHRLTTPSLAQAKRIRSSGRWQKVRAIKLDASPLCQECNAQGITEPAVEVDHVRPIVERPDLAFDLRNLRALCTRCHARKSARERS